MVRLCNYGGTPTQNVRTRSHKMEERAEDVGKDALVRVIFSRHFRDFPRVGSDVSV